MRRSLHRHPEARADVEAAALFIGKDDPAVALRFLDAVEATLGILLENPGLGAPRRFERAVLSGLRSFPVIGFEKHLIFYRPARDRIEVVRVLHGARDIDGILGRAPRFVRTGPRTLRSDTVRLTTTDHDRDKAGLRYVYPVVSRRAGGVSVGINLNPNKACNWRCAYCQVEGLVRGSGPPIDLGLLERELDAFLGDVLHGAFMERHVPEGARSLRDVALSGDGEPTSSPDLGPALDVVGRVLERHGLLGELPVVLITNGSLVHKRAVHAALVRLRELGGIVWYKLDSATPEGQARWNDAHAGVARARANLALAAAACPTWVQTFVAAWDGKPPSDAEQAEYLDLLAGLVADGVPLRGVLLYGLARASHQPEAARLAPLPAAWLEAFAGRIGALGLAVRVSP